MQVLRERCENIVIKKSRDWAKYIACGEFHLGFSEQESGLPSPESQLSRWRRILRQNLEAE